MEQYTHKTILHFIARLLFLSQLIIFFRTLVGGTRYQKHLLPGV